MNQNDSSFGPSGLIELSDCPPRSGKIDLHQLLESSHVAEQAIRKARTCRKVNSGAPVLANPATPWYRRFEKR